MAPAPDPVVVEIKLGDLVLARGEEGITFGDLVVEAAAEKLLERAARQPDYTNLHDRIRKIRDDEITAAVRPLIERALAAAVQPTDSFGNAKGDKTTLSEIIVKAATHELRRDESPGRTVGRRSVLNAVVHEEVEKALRRELKDAVEEAKVDVVRAVREEAAAVIGETVARFSAGRA